jgi:hypothetical protein
MKIIKLFFVVIFLGNALHAADAQRSFEKKYSLAICKDDKGNPLLHHIIEPNRYKTYSDATSDDWFRVSIANSYNDKVISADKWLKNQDEISYYNTVIRPEVSFFSRLHRDVVFEKHGYLATGEYLILVSIKQRDFYFFEIKIPKYSKESFSSKPALTNILSDGQMLLDQTFSSSLQRLTADGEDLLSLILKIKKAIEKQYLTY